MAGLAASSGATGSSTPEQPAEGASRPTPEPREAPRPYFSERAEALGVDFRHDAGHTGDYFIARINGSGVALFDADGDGDLDLFLVQGGHLEEGERSDAPSDRLFLNRLDGRAGTQALAFEAAPQNGGIAERAFGFGAATGDIEGDGDVDLYVTNFGRNQLWRNRGDGTFEDATAAAGLVQNRWSVAASFFDYDADGVLDLYVGNYLAVAADENKVCRTSSGARDFCGPTAYPGAGDHLWRGRGDGTFEDVSLATGVGRPRGRSLGAVTGDFDEDGRLDLYVTNDQEPNFLWLNRGAEGFLDDALLAGAAVNGRGRAEASMGVDAADLDGNGTEDLFMTHLVTETNTLFLNEGGASFHDATARRGLGAPSLPRTGWGTRAFDVDNDGHLDLLVANGAVRVIEKLAEAGDPFPFHEPNQLFRNTGTRFEDVSPRSGSAFALSEVSRGAAFGDLDNDGDTDVVVTQNDGPVRVLINDTGQDNAWLGVRLTTATRGALTDALGAVGLLERPGRPPLVRRARTDGSFASASDPRLVFGLGPLEGNAEPATLRVRWPDGAEETFEGLGLQRYHTLVRGEGTGVEAPP